jgi:single-strand DNA-binding protein
MARSVNLCTFIGNLGRDAETAYTPSGIAKTKFSIATERRWKDKQSGDWKSETDWIPVILWRSENLANYLLKGQQVYVQGRMSVRSYDDKDGTKKWITEIVADVVNLLGSGKGEKHGDGDADHSASPASSVPYDDSDEVPF